MPRHYALFELVYFFPSETPVSRTILFETQGDLLDELRAAWEDFDDHRDNDSHSILVAEDFSVTAYFTDPVELVDNGPSLIIKYRGGEVIKSAYVPNCHAMVTRNLRLEFKDDLGGHAGTLTPGRVSTFYTHKDFNDFRSAAAVEKYFRRILFQLTKEISRSACRPW